jgi:hypothetical protein
MGGSCSTQEKMRNIYKILVRKPEGVRPLERPGHRWEYNIKMDLMEMGWEVSDRIHMAQDSDRWRTFVNTVTILRAP